MARVRSLSALYYMESYTHYGCFYTYCGYTYCGHAH